MTSKSYLSLFINADAIGGKVGTLLSHNMFAYCFNNAVNMEDPNGYWPKWATITVVAVAVVAVVAVAIVAPGVIPAVATAVSNAYYAAGAALTVASWKATEVIVNIVRGTPVSAAPVNEVAPKVEQTTKDLSQKIINGLKDAKVQTKVNKLTGKLEPYMKQFKLDDNYKVVLRRDVGEAFNHGDLNHWNLELQTLKGNLRYDLHLYVDEFVEIFKTGEYIPK